MTETVGVRIFNNIFSFCSLRLRNVLRKAISISKDVFKCPPETLTSLYDKVADILGPVYPELYDKASHCKKIILHEEQMLLHLEKRISEDRKALLEKYPETSRLPYNLLPGLAEGYKQFKMVRLQIVLHFVIHSAY